MNKIRNMCGKFFLVCVCMASGIAVYAQEVISTYDMKIPKHPGYWYSGFIPIIGFGVLFVIGIYLIYHFWANGRLRDDMS